MSEPRITWQRRRFVEILSQYPYISFRDLKKELVGKGEEKMDLTTLYRIVDTFQKQGLIHQGEISGEKIIFPCNAEGATANDAVRITICKNCNTLYDTHTPLESQYVKSTTHAIVRKCDACA